MEERKEEKEEKGAKKKKKSIRPVAVTRLKDTAST